MHVAHTSAYESDRLQALQRYHILDTTPEICFDQLAALAAHICEAPFACISFVDEDRVWIKASSGFSLTEIPRATSWCAHTILQAEPLVIADVRLDQRCANNSLTLGEPYVRFYAGARVVTTSGHALGAICVMGCEPRQLRDDQCVALSLLSQQVMTLCELRNARLEMMQESKAAGLSEVDVHAHAMRLANAQSMAHMGSWEMNLLTGAVTYSAEMYRLVGRDPALGPMTSEQFFRLVHADDIERIMSIYAEAMNLGTVHRMEFRFCHPDKGLRWFEGFNDAVADDQRRVIGIYGTVQDITERKQAEVEIAEWKQRYEATIHASGQILYDWNPYTNHVSYGGDVLRILGYNADEMVGGLAHWLELIHPDDRVRFNREVERVMRVRSPFCQEYRIQRKDGRWLTMQDDGHFILDGSGSITRMVGFVADITARKSVESALRASEARLAAAQERAHIGSWEVDLATQQVTSSAEAYRILGLDPASNPSFADIVAMVHPDDRKYFAEIMEKLKAGHGPAQQDVRMIRPDGSICWIERRVELIRDDRGRPVRIIGTSQDITTRRLAEAALHESDKRFRQIVQMANEGIWTIDAEARTTFVNPKMATMLGYSVEEMSGRLATDFLDEEGKAITKVNLERRRQGIAEQYDFKFRHKNGSELWALVVTNPLTDAEGAFAGAMAMVTDITDRRRLEDELRHAHKMEAVGRLAGGIAHDFNNQLTVIQGYGSMAMAKSRDDQVIKCLTRVVSAATRSADLVKQLLSFSRKGRYSEVPVEVHSVITETLDVLGCTLSKNIRLRHVFNVSNTIVTGDASLLQNAFLNLALNARDAMPDGGELTFVTTLVDLDKERVARLRDGMSEGLNEGMAIGQYLLVTISDTGAGMSAEIQQHLFEPFFSTKAPGQGTGLGLASVYGTIRQHGGGIEVDSGVGRGTTFRVYLPTTVASVQQPFVEPLAPKLKSAANILVVDDEKLVATLVADTLADFGHDVVCKEDGLAGLKHYRTHWQAIDLVILDMNMPNMNGPETFAAMRAINPQAKVMVISGYSEDGGVDQLLKNGAMGFIAKPFRTAALEHEVLRILG